MRKYLRTKLRNQEAVRYPWDEWIERAKQRPLRLRQGIDFLCQTHSMSVQIRTAFSNRGYLPTVVFEDHATLVIEEIRSA